MEVELLRGNITTIAVDAIVNAANSMLAGGGGVDGAIHRAAGPDLMKELNQFDGCPPGRVVVTGAGMLPAKFVIHAVGPVYRGGDRGEAELLASCYRRALEAAHERGCKSISFPAISTGVYGYPVDKAAQVSLTAITETLARLGDGIEAVKLVQFNEFSYRAYLEVWAQFQSSTVKARSSQPL